jgi:hypothetical protein
MYHVRKLEDLEPGAIHGWSAGKLMKAGGAGKGDPAGVKQSLPIAWRSFTFPLAMRHGQNNNTRHNRQQ